MDRGVSGYWRDGKSGERARKSYGAREVGKRPLGNIVRLRELFTLANELG
jgi:hypothetical protein